MKMKQEHYKAIEQAMKNKEKECSGLRELYQQNGLTKLRFGWDLLHRVSIGGVASTKYICDVLYIYLNDAHIDTAINKIVGEY